MRLKYRKALNNRQRRHVRVRAKVKGTSQRPRLCVFRSSAHIYAQVIDDTAGHTMVSASDLEEAVKVKAGAKATKSDRAKAVGDSVADRAKEAGISRGRVRPWWLSLPWTSQACGRWCPRKGTAVLNSSGLMNELGIEDGDTNG